MEQRAQEREFFSRDGVYVSMTRFVTAGQTYAMSGVTSVRAAELKPSYMGAILCAIFGALLAFVGCFGSGLLLLVGILLLIPAGVLASTKQTEYAVQLSVSSGEVAALRSRDRELIADVVQALNDCIVARG